MSRGMQGHTWRVKIALAGVIRSASKCRARRRSSLCDRNEGNFALCHGEVSAVTCPECGTVLRRCLDHGGLRGAQLARLAHVRGMHATAPNRPCEPPAPYRAMLGVVPPALPNLWRPGAVLELA
jgi:hypothetical protein